MCVLGDLEAEEASGGACLRGGNVAGSLAPRNTSSTASGPGSGTVSDIQDGCYDRELAPTFLVSPHLTNYTHLPY